MVSFLFDRCNVIPHMIPLNTEHLVAILVAVLPVCCWLGLLVSAVMVMVMVILMVQEDVPEGSTLTPWAQCDKCLKWRRIPWYVDPEQLPHYWVCADNEWDPERASCDVSHVIRCLLLLLD